MSISLLDNHLLTSVEALNTRLEFLSINLKSMSDKGINIDDQTAVLTPLSHNPPKHADTFPHSWSGTSTQIPMIRTFHYSSGVAAKDWVTWAVQNGIKVMVGLTLGADSGAAEIAAFEADYKAADATLQAQYDANVVAIAVGNEQTDVAGMNAGMISVKSKITGGTLPANALVTTVLELTNTWINIPFPPQGSTFTASFMSLVPNLEIVCFNCYGGYFSKGSIPPLTAAQALERSLSWTSTATEFSVLLNQFGAIRYAMAAATINLPFWCTETGWASVAVGSEENGWSSVPHLKTFYQNFLGFDLSSTFLPQASTPAVSPPDKIFYFSVRDVTDEQQYFGLYEATSTPLSPKF